MIIHYCILLLLLLLLLFILVYLWIIGYIKYPINTLA